MTDQDIVFRVWKIEYTNITDGGQVTLKVHKTMIPLLYKHSNI